MSARGRVLAGLVGLCVSAGVFASPALAGTGHGFSTSFGGAGSGAGQFKEPEGVAVNDSSSLAEPGAGDVYVVDKGNGRVERFSAAGAYLGQFNGSGSFEVEGKTETGAAAPTGAFSGPVWVAVDGSGSALDPSAGDVYVTDNGHKVVDKFSSTGAYLGQITTGEAGHAFGELYGVAVDPQGRLWVYQSSKEIDDYSDALSNEFLAPDREMPFETAPGFTVGPEGDLYPMYVSNVFLQLSPTGEFLKLPWGSAGNQEYATAAAVDPAGEAYVDNITTVGAFSATDTLNQRFGKGHLSSGAGIAVNFATGAVYVADSVGEDVAVFAEGPTPEEPKTEPASEVGSTTATLHGQLNPKGAAGALEYQFDYNKGSACAGGQSAPVPAGEVANAAKANVEVKVTGLQPSASYTFCVVAINTNGATQGNEVSLTTTGAAPEVLGESAPAPKATAATLAASINPNNQETTYTFEYSTSKASVETGAGTKVAGASAIPKEEFGPQSVSVTVEPLAPETLYYYRVTAENAKGEKSIPGKVEAFTSGPPEKPETLKPEPVTTTTAVLKGVLNPHKPGNPGTYEFLYNQGGACEGGSVTPRAHAAGATPEPVSAEITGLLPNATYTVCLRAGNEAEETTLGPPVTFTTLAVAPALAGEAATNLTTTSAVLNATVDPESLPVLTCTFEYGTSTSYEHSEPCTHPNATELGSGRTPIAVTHQLEGLHENTVYHWRILATNTAGTTTSPDHTFVYDTSGEGLPDNRAYEMVTPPQKNGALIGDAPLGISPAVSEDGSRVLAPSIQCFADAQSCTAKQLLVATLYQFSRTSGGWQAHALAPPANVLSSSSTENYGENGAVLFAGPTPPHEEDDFYARLPGAGSLFDVGPLTPPEAGARGPKVAATGLVYGTADMSHVLWSNSRLASGPDWPSIDKSSGTYTTYEYVGRGNAQPLLVGVNNEGNLISLCETEPGAITEEGGATALSADGRTVYFTAVGTDSPQCAGTASPPVSEVFARVGNGEAGAHTVAISEPSAFATAAPYFGCEAEPCIKDVNVAANFRDGWFVDASADGSKAFFASTQQLTDGASEDPGHADSALANGCETTTGAGGCNLYEHDSAAPAGDQLIDLSAGDSSGGGPRVQGVVAISPDGSHVYFVAHGVLTTAANIQGQTARDGAENLYVSQGGHTTFIATLPSSDAPQWEYSDKSANVTPEGRFLVFLSHGDLTPDDTSRSGALQVFRYDAATGELTRSSIGNDGYNDNGNRSSPTPCKGAGFGCSEDAGIVHGYGSHLLGVPRRDPTMSNDGARVFFQSPVGLTPHALDDVQIATEETGDPVYAQNVYEWEERGMGSCTRVTGCVSLISDGRDVSIDNALPNSCPPGHEHPSSVCLLGSDATGSNVFFTTADQLVPADTDTEFDIYDARICEPENGNPCIQPSPAPSPPCLGEACHGIPAAVLGAQSGGSLTFNGAGNITPVAPAVKKKTVKCKRGFVKNKKNKCIHKPKKKKNKARKSAHINRRAPR
jgi:hypothetical protein